LTLLLTTLLEKLWRDARSRQALSSQIKPNRAGGNDCGIDPTPPYGDVRTPTIMLLAKAALYGYSASKHTGFLVALLAELFNLLARQVEIKRSPTKLEI
jgi:hypothetical protein